MPTGVVSGLRRETECLASPDGTYPEMLTFAGVGAERAAEGARRLLAEGAGALVSFGVCGGLAPQAHAGELVLCDSVVDGDVRFQTDPAWRDTLRRRLGNAVPIIEGAVCGVDAMVASVAAKRALFEATGAVGCDMESHAVARVAAEAGVPFMVLRAVSDPDTHDVPTWVLRCLTPVGGVRYGKLLGALARRPWTLPAVITLARNSKKAFASLRSVARLAGPGLGGL